MDFIQNNQYTHEAIAQKISWQPIQKNGTPLTNMILESREGVLALQLNILARFFYFSFIMLGVMFIVYATYKLLLYNFQTTLWFGLPGFILTGVGIYMFSKQAIPHVFDKKKNIYFKKNENLECEDETPLNAIHALQVISYSEEDESKSEEQAELNLVLNNGERIYVCSYDTDECERAKKDVQEISKYLNKPILTGSATLICS